MIGTRLGPYEITAKLGEGGMGEVWRATDSQLGRDVALKVLPAAFTADPDRSARFEREAKLLASLNHPNIAQIYGLETSGSTRALVMELVEGPTLAERMESGALGRDESLALARQIAEALEAAHEKGIVHRDLKPQNVKAAPDGRVKVLDFGLAKAMDPAGASGMTPHDLAHSPTVTFGGTREGVILGTAAYMAPEQARGDAVDKRADIWAFGVVLHEMLTGERLFVEGSVVDTLSAVMRKPIDFDQLPAATPRRLRELLRRCLERNPRNRLHDIADARIVLDELLAEPTALDPNSKAGAVSDVGTARPRRGVAAFAGTALVGVLVGGLVGSWLSGFGERSQPPRPETKIIALVSSGTNAWPAFSPDGRTVAFASERDGTSRIWIQDLRSGAESAVSEDGASSPRFSPDGGSLLYSLSRGVGSQSDLYRRQLVGGDSRRLVVDAADGDWSPDGVSLAYVRSPSDESAGFRIGVVPIAGGDERILATSVRQLKGPRWSADGRSIAVAQVGPSTGISDQILLIDAQSATVREIALARSDGAPLRVAGLAWLDATSVLLLAGDLEAAAFRSSSGRIARLDLATGEIRSLLPLPDVWRGIDVAADGNIVVTTGSVAQNLAVEPFPPEPGVSPTWLTEGSYSDRQPTWSPDGESILFSSDRSGNLDLWTVSVGRRELSRVTFDPGDDWDPAWSPESSRVLFGSNRSGKFQIWMADAGGSAPRQVTKDENAQNPTMTADGQWIVYNSFDPDPARRGLWKIRPDGTGAVRLVAGTPNVPDVSRDGRYVAFRGETGRTETRIARTSDGGLLDFALRGVTRLRWRPATRPTLALLRNEDDTTRFGVRQYVGNLGLVEIGADDTVGAPRWFEPTPASRGAETFDFSPDGRRVVFSSVRGVNSRIFLVEGLIERGEERNRESAP